MSSVTFLGPLGRDGMMQRVEVRLAAGERCTLLRLIERHDIPGKCICRSGECGSCAVKVALLHEVGTRPEVHIGAAEKKTLFASGKLTRQQFSSPFLAYRAPLWRLACQYVVGDEDIVVALQ